MSDLIIEVPGGEEPETTKAKPATKAKPEAVASVNPDEVGKPDKGRWVLFENGWDWVGTKQENA